MVRLRWQEALVIAPARPNPPYADRVSMSVDLIPGGDTPINSSIARSNLGRGARTKKKNGSPK